MTRPRGYTGLTCSPATKPTTAHTPYVTNFYSAVNNFFYTIFPHFFLAIHYVKTTTFSTIHVICRERLATHAGDLGVGAVHARVAPVAVFALVLDGARVAAPATVVLVAHRQTLTAVVGHLLTLVHHH